MARNVFQILDDLAAGVRELKAALAPLAGFPSSGSQSEIRHARSRSRGKTASLKIGAKIRSSKPTTSLKSAPTSKPARKKPASTAKSKAAARQQGFYLGAIRGLNDAQKTRVKKERQENGFGAAMKLAGSFKKS